MKHVSTCLSVLVLSTLLFPGSIRGQTSQPTTGKGGTGVSATSAPGGLSTISVANYGARGDGSADDTAAINSAMSACVARALPHNGCVLYFPAGVYITTGLTLRSYVNIKGDGWGASVLLLKPHTAANVLTVPVDAFNFSITGLTLDGNSENGGSGNCFFVAPTSKEPAEWNTANKQTAPVNAQKWGHVEEVMFSHCSVDGIHINAFNYMLFFDNFYVFDNGVYGIYTEGTNSGFTNFQIERNGTAGIHLAGSNDRFTSGEVIWNGGTVGTEAAVYVSGARNIITAVETEDSYTNGFFDKGNDNVFMGCVSDSNGYAPKNVDASSRVASGFVIAGSGGVYIGDKVTSYRSRLPDGNFTTEWPYRLENRDNGKIDITYDSTNKPPRTR
ncbi:glycosyl hydrolase family 28-related protein [Tunturiibacter psychrotolerans]|uniref:glycosyl hydrolase family 28-related protein n=1 Tax=Tunturiibacter psychrotolerans TaxID=3069686 RepID=UPI003D1EF6F4